MKFQKLKYMISGGIIATMIFNVVPVAFAKVSQMNIPVTYNNIKVLIDGKQLLTDKEPFIYDGTTYLPVRAVGEAVGKDVSWDGKTNTVLLNSKMTEVPKNDYEEDTEKEEIENVITNSKEYSRTNPAPVETEQIYKYESDYGTDYTVKLKITSAYRGTSAWNMIKRANMFNDEAPNGKEYILIDVKAEVIDVEDDKAINFDEYDFTPFSGSNSEYERKSIVEPKPQFEASVYKGGTTEGYIAFLVDKSDTHPKVVYGENYDGTGGVWFEITK